MKLNQSDINHFNPIKHKISKPFLKIINKNISKSSCSEELFIKKIQSLAQIKTFFQQSQQKQFHLRKQQPNEIQKVFLMLAQQNQKLIGQMANKDEAINELRQKYNNLKYSNRTLALGHLKTQQIQNNSNYQSRFSKKSEKSLQRALTLQKLKSRLNKIDFSSLLLNKDNSNLKKSKLL